MARISIRLPIKVLFGAALLGLTACGGEGGVHVSQVTPAATGAQYVVFAWNDLGMHCLNPSYDTAVILPPYNTVWAQVVRRGSPPQVVTAGLSAEYRIVDNTSSVHKRSFGQFWTYVQQLFGVTLSPDTGLNLETPTLHNGLSGTMVAKADHFQVNGIPVTPVNDADVWNPYQVVEVTIKDSGGTVLAQTRATVPTSDEINCAKCHGSNPFTDILQRHDAAQGTALMNQRPVLCASCHGSPALGQSGKGSSGKYLSEAIHGFHASLGAACYDCHPGTSTKCNRSLAHTAADGNCSNASCHGSMATLAAAITSGAKVPWLTEPRCVSCHADVAEVDTGTTLYRNAVGHGGMYCAGCHGSPHAMVPSREASDNYQALQYQGVAKSLGSCGACHSGSRGAGLGEFLQEHGGGGQPTACSICHTQIATTDVNSWPHKYQWRNR
jgi:predicted CxxxxCH...CXXCH cytochrome family protein